MRPGSVTGLMMGMWPSRLQVPIPTQSHRGRGPAIVGLALRICRQGLAVLADDPMNGLEIAVRQVPAMGTADRAGVDVEGAPQELPQQERGLSPITLQGYIGMEARR
jgi:hypothetical protein